MADALYDGRPFRALTVIDEGNREALAIEIGTSISSARVIRVLDELVRLYGRPARVRVDNGPELVAEAFVEWCAAQQIGLGYIQPGRPDQNAFIERSKRTFREEVLDAYLFGSLEDVRAITDAWLDTYSPEPDDSLGQVPPLTFLPRPTSCPRGVCLRGVYLTESSRWHRDKPCRSLLPASRQQLDGRPRVTAQMLEGSRTGWDPQCPSLAHYVRGRRPPGRRPPRAHVPMLTILRSRRASSYVSTY